MKGTNDLVQKILTSSPLHNHSSSSAFYCNSLVGLVSRFLRFRKQSLLLFDKLLLSCDFSCVLEVGWSPSFEFHLIATSCQRPFIWSTIPCVTKVRFRIPAHPQGAVAVVAKIALRYAIPDINAIIIINSSTLMCIIVLNAKIIY